MASIAPQQQQPYEAVVNIAQNAASSMFDLCWLPYGIVFANLDVSSHVLISNRSLHRAPYLLTNMLAMASACTQWYGLPLQVTVKNSIGKDAWPSLYEGITIHWHGFSLKGFAWMDGTKYVAQCPITPGSSFTYKFQVRMATANSAVTVAVGVAW